MANVPDLDDLLDQIESTVTSGGGTPGTGKSRTNHRAFFDPVPCFPTTPAARSSTVLPFSPEHLPPPQRTAEEKLSFIEFLKVTAKEAEELQRLHDDTQIERSSKRITPATKSSVATDSSLMEDTTRQEAFGRIEEPDLPEFPDVPDHVLVRLPSPPAMELAAAMKDNFKDSEQQENPFPHEPVVSDVNGVEEEPEERPRPIRASASARSYSAGGLSSGFPSGRPSTSSLFDACASDRSPAVESPFERPPERMDRHADSPFMRLDSVPAVLKELREVQVSSDAAINDSVNGNADVDDYDAVLEYLAKADPDSAAIPTLPDREAEEEDRGLEMGAVHGEERSMDDADPEDPQPRAVEMERLTSFEAPSPDEVDLAELDELDASDLPLLAVAESARQDTSEPPATLPSPPELLPRLQKRKMLGDEEVAEEASEVPPRPPKSDRHRLHDKVSSLDEPVPLERPDGYNEMVEARTHEAIVRTQSMTREDASSPEAGEPHLEHLHVPQSPAEETFYSTVSHLDASMNSCDEHEEIENDPSIDNHGSIHDDTPLVLEEVDLVFRGNAKTEDREALLEHKEAVTVSASFEAVRWKKDEEEGEQEAEDEVAVEHQTGEEPSEGDIRPFEGEYAEIENVGASAARQHETFEGEYAQIENSHVSDRMHEEVPENEYAEITNVRESTADDEATMEDGEGEDEAAAEEERPRRAHIADVREFDGDEEEGRRGLTESELQLGKVQPIWIPDVDCAACMLCSLRFSFINRRHHCRACGRVLCAGCCSEKALLAYQTDTKKVRVCAPCLETLARVEEFERSQGDEDEGERSARDSPPGDDIADPDALPQPESTAVRKKKSILKVRASAVLVAADETGGGEGEEGPSTSAGGVGRGERGVVFRDGVKPGERTSTDGPLEEEEKSTALKPPKKKPSRKRAAVSRRVAALKVEEQASSVLPTAAHPLLVVETGQGTRHLLPVADAEAQLAAGEAVKIVESRLLTCTIRICEAPSGSGCRVLAVASHGLHAIGLDEIAFVWSFDEASIIEEEVEGQEQEEGVEATEEEGEEKDKEEEETQTKKETIKRCPLPLHVVERIAEILRSSFSRDGNLTDVRKACIRMPKMHTSTVADDQIVAPLTRHTLLWRPTHQSMRGLPLAPSVPYVFATPVLEQELMWSLAAPNRLLLRLGQQAACYPFPLVIDANRAPVYTEETSASVLKMFNDFSSWSYRMTAIPGATVSLCDDETIVTIPRSARAQIRKIVEVNRNMLAWLCDINTEADSHLVCLEADGGAAYETNIFRRGDDRKLTGASFVIIDGALKTPGAKVQVSVCEDGIAVRLPSDTLVEAVNILLEGKDFTVETPGMKLTLRWKRARGPAGTGLRSLIDGYYYGDKYQYGLTLERAVSSTIPIASLPDTGLRLSHVFNLRDGPIPVEDEAKVFSVAELLTTEATAGLEEYLPLLAAFGIETISLRLAVERERLEYDVSPWTGLEEQGAAFRERLDNLVPVFYNLLGHIPAGFQIEIYLTIVSTAALPIE